MLPRTPPRAPLDTAWLISLQARATTSMRKRKQYMFSMLSSQQVDQMYAQSYQETVSTANAKGVLDKTSANAKR